MAGRILIADGAATNRIILRVKLASARHDVFAVNDGESALNAATERAPDLIIVDERLEDMAGTELCKRLKSNPITQDIPVIVVMVGQDRDARIAALNAGADEFLTLPVDEMTLLARVRSLLRTKKTRDALKERQCTVEELGFAEPQGAFAAPGRIVLVAGSAERGLNWRSELSSLLTDRIDLKTIGGALADANQDKGADVFVIDADLGQPGEGLRLLAELRSRPGSRHSAILVVHDAADKTSAVMALDLGANDLVPGNFEPTELALRIKTQLGRKRDDDKLRESVDAGLRLAMLDPLTELFNRRYVMSHAARLLDNARARGRGLVTLVADIDQFKRVNDTYGHQAGDLILIEVARRLKDSLRSADLIARTGGEEFLVVMPDIEPTVALWRAQKICNAIGDTAFTLPHLRTSINVTISIGLAAAKIDDSSEGITALIDRADRALYDAKSSGRNKVSVGNTRARTDERSVAAPPTATVFRRVAHSG